MYAERRLAFEKRIGELFADHRAAYPFSNIRAKEWRDIGARILSALEDSFQMGRRADMGAEQLHAEERAASAAFAPPTPDGDEKNG